MKQTELQESLLTFSRSRSLATPEPIYFSFSGYDITVWMLRLARAGNKVDKKEVKRALTRLVCRKKLQFVYDIGFLCLATPEGRETPHPTRLLQDKLLSFISSERHKLNAVQIMNWTTDQPHMPGCVNRDNVLAALTQLIRHGKLQLLFDATEIYVKAIPKK